MDKILVIHLGTLIENFIASSVLRGLCKKYVNPEITWVTATKNIGSIFKYNKKIKNVLTFKQLEKNKDTFDLLINLSPALEHEICPDVKIKDVKGFDFSKRSDDFFEIFYNNKTTQLNYFQLYYKLAGLNWKGEGYSIAYYPRNHCKKNRVGISVANANLRNYVSEKLDLKPNKLWHIPYKRNIFKKIDEINRCKKIITDDFITFNVAVFLRKYVYFLKTCSYNVKLEFFKQGKIFPIPVNFVR